MAAIRGYEYREAVDTGIDADLETPTTIQPPAAIAPTTTVGRPDTGAPVADALINIAGDEIGELTKERAARQSVQGAIDAGLGKGMEEIGKRQGFNDALFGTRARRESAAKIKASVGVNAYFSDELSNLTHKVRTKPEEYIEEQRQVIALTYARIQEEEGVEVANAFVAQANQRLEQLVQTQVQKHHAHLQATASSDFQKDIISRAAIITQLYAEPGMEMQADADLEKLFDENNRPIDMTLEAWHNNIAKVIISEASAGNRRLYEYADQQGVLDNMPAELRMELDATYRDVAPINNLEFIDATQSLLEDMYDPTVPLEEFISRQERFTVKWDGTHTYSNKQLAEQRIRKQKALATGKKQSDDDVDLTNAWIKGDHVALSGTEVSEADRQRAASNGMLLVSRPHIVRSHAISLDEFDSLPEGRQRELMFQELQSNEVLLGQVINRGARSGYPIKELQRVLNDGTTALTVGGALNPKAVESLNLQRRFVETQPEFIHSNITDHALLNTYDRLKNVGYTDEQALQAIVDAKENPIKSSTYPPEVLATAQTEAFGQFLQHAKVKRNYGWIGAREIDNAAEVNTELNRLASIHMDRGFSPEDSFSAAARELSSAYELVGNSAVFNRGIPLSTRAGINPDVPISISEVLTKQLDEMKANDTLGGFNWNGKLNDYLVQFNTSQNTLFLTPTKGDVLSLNRQIPIPLIVLGKKANSIHTSELQADADAQAQEISESNIERVSAVSATGE